MADPKLTPEEDAARQKEEARQKERARAAGTAYVPPADRQRTGAASREVVEAQEAEAAALTAGEMPPTPTQQEADLMKEGHYPPELEQAQAKRRDAAPDNERAGYKTR